MHFDKSYGDEVQEASSDKHKPDLTRHCLKCGAKLNDAQPYCESCAVTKNPLKQAKLLVLLLISISFFIGLTLIITA